MEAELKKKIEQLGFDLVEISTDMDFVFGADVKDMINELIADDQSPRDIYDRIDSPQVKLVDDELEVNIEDDDVLLVIYGDSYDQYYNAKDYVYPVSIMNAVDARSNRDKNFKKAMDIIDEVREILNS